MDRKVKETANYMKIDPRSTALLVVDMQKDFYAKGGNASRRGNLVSYMRALPGKINDFSSRLRLLGVKIVFTKFVYDPSRSPANYAEKLRLAKVNDNPCRIGTDGVELAGVAVQDGDLVIEKFSYDCFAGTDLLWQLQEWGIESVIICGVRTEICVLAAVERSFSEGFRTFVARDLVGTRDDQEAVANAVLSALRYTAYIMTSDEIEKVVNGAFAA